MVDLNELRLIKELRESGVTWEEMSDYVPNYTDNDRKLFRGYELGQQDIDSSDIVKLAKQKQTIRTARKELGIERSINNEQIRDISLYRTFNNQVIDAIENRYSDFEIVYFDNDVETTTAKAHIFSLADFHYDGDTKYLETIQNACNRILDVVKEKRLDNIILLELGDIIEGASLRTSQLMGIKSGMVNQIIDVADAYIKLIEELSSFTNVKFYSVDSSNHTQLRNLGTKQNNLIEEDLMLVFNRIIRTALPNLEMVTGEDLLFDVLGFKVFASHGHLVKSKEKYLETLQADRNILIDYGFFAHFHHQRTIDLHKANGYDKKVFYVPSLNTKPSSYEKDKNLSSQAGVGYYMFDEKEGHIETRKLII